MGYSARYHAASLAAVFLALAVGILIGVGIAGYKAAIKAANEAAAVKTLRSISEQQMLYFNSHQRSSFGTFEEMRKENLLDSRFDGRVHDLLELAEDALGRDAAEPRRLPADRRRRGRRWPPARPRARSAWPSAGRSG